MRKTALEKSFLTAFEVLWCSLFVEGRHLDSSLRDTPRELRAVLAKISRLILRIPHLLCESLDVTWVEPWTNDSKSSSPIIWKSKALELAGKLFKMFNEQPNGIFIESKQWHELMKTLDQTGASYKDFPPLIVKELQLDREMGIPLSQVLRFLAQDPPLTLRLSKKLDREQWIREEASKFLKDTPNLKIWPAPISPFGVVLDQYVPVSQHDDFISGRFEIQDEGSQLISLYTLDPLQLSPFLTLLPFTQKPKVMIPGLKFIPLSSRIVRKLRVVDACSGAGGKALALSDYLGGAGRIFAYDVVESKIRGLKFRVTRLGLNNIQGLTLPKDENLMVQWVKKFEGTADIVLVDVPCSGWGVLRKSPDIKWKTSVAELTRLSTLQKQLLSLYSRLVKLNGLLVYSTCTFRRGETRAVVDDFLSNTGSSSVAKTSGVTERLSFTPLSQGGYLDSVEPYGCDAYFMQAFQRN